MVYVELGDIFWEVSGKEHYGLVAKEVIEGGGSLVIH